MGPKPCAACGKSPSGLIRWPHEFCEHCGARFAPDAPAESAASATPRRQLKCYRCGTAFDWGEGERPFCPACVALLDDPGGARPAAEPLQPGETAASAGGTVTVGAAGAGRLVATLVAAFLFCPLGTLVGKLVGPNVLASWAAEHGQLLVLGLVLASVALVPLRAIDSLRPRSASLFRRRLTWREHAEQWLIFAAFLLGVGLVSWLQG